MYALDGLSMYVLCQYLVHFDKEKVEKIYGTAEITYDT